MSCSAEREAELKSQGWSHQFMAAEPRLSEAVEAYRSLGFEVHLEPVDPTACQSSDTCTACLESPDAAKRLKIIFTRPAQPREEDLA